MLELADTENLSFNNKVAEIFTQTYGLNDF